MLAAGQSTYPLAGIVDARLPISLHLFTVFFGWLFSRWLIRRQKRERDCRKTQETRRMLIFALALVARIA
ncbi:hypothetical protein C3731_01510 [Brucella oryzae]|uniref:Uncharacterized protein n=1 Tax=Brucella oryzae TaxID=335286 RepID=A0A2S7J4X9_9HYPH|nr:hypothetical protein C3731_01510 [Brucella oryzae]